MFINSTRFGQIEIDEQQIFNFEYGLPGFPEEEKFAFLPHTDEKGEKTNFAYLQSLQTAELTFLLADPFAFFPDYGFSLEKTTEAQLGTNENNQPMIWVIGLILNKLEDMTVNLLAPLLFNTQNQKARQIILENTDYTTRHPLFAKEGGK